MTNLRLVYLTLLGLALCLAKINPAIYKGTDKLKSVIYEFDCSDAVVSRFAYTLTPEKARVIDTPFRTGGGFCGDALTPGTLDLGEFKDVPVQPKDINTAAWNRLRNLECCRGNTCPGCYDKVTKGQCVMTLTVVKESNAKEVLPTLLCIHCHQLSCFDGFCNNGQYASKVNDLDPVTYLALTPVGCYDCAPGTWNTCKYKESCKWTVPQRDFTNMSQDVHTIAKGPVGACYPCAWASTNFFHYTNSPTKASTITPDKDWKCPGGDSAPVNCRDDMVRSQGYDKCVCMMGTYDDGGPTCTKCPPGFFCKDGVKTPCPDHKYQFSPGASECIPCVDSLDEKGVYTACGEGRQLEWCLQSKPGTQNKPLLQNCRPCNQCKRSFITSVDGQVGCYRS